MGDLSAELRWADSHPEESLNPERFGRQRLFMRAANEIDRLKAIITKPPSTADGVLVVHDMEAWARLCNRVTWVKILEIQRGGRVYCNVHYGMEFKSLRLSDIYSTRKAAEAKGGG